MQDEEVCQKIELLINFLKNTYGYIDWWPGTPDEIIIGSILTQQTKWKNVENAILNLREQNISSLKDINNASFESIGEAIKCTGFYRLKTDRLKELSHFILSVYVSAENMKNIPTDVLRKELLSIKGVGPETADSILCYGLSKNSFVIDAYTEKICKCADILVKKSDLKSLFEKVLPESNMDYRTCHAWFVEYGKEYCTNKRCDECKIRNLR
ncbi:Fe-S cluster assembly protein HesB [Methanoplanus sp. FWC-SCC4]|uniref:Fe-S cluster assembly protein HesB n=1 Tax=Methanochimaera problematica TaxID=2609417 RepID=A0AA97I2A8_9EURY|nr:Fe-S cluster assembly protein HesB [Methanoplanus sp. FWC-SCC4]WOF16065.1 Fe-S cluster assembly protein HesB [Methanoplanus sp. FWC-SCC4]